MPIGPRAAWVSPSLGPVVLGGRGSCLSPGPAIDLFVAGGNRNDRSGLRTHGLPATQDYPGSRVTWYYPSTLGYYPT